MNMNFGTNKAPAETIKEGLFRETFLEIFILVFMINGIESHRRNLKS